MVGIVLRVMMIVMVMMELIMLVMVLIMVVLIVMMMLMIINMVVVRGVPRILREGDAHFWLTYSPPPPS